MIGNLIYNCIAVLEILAALILMAHFVYLEPVIDSKKGRTWFLGCFFAVLLVLQLWPGCPTDTLAAVPMIFFCLHVAVTRKKRRIRGLFLLFPVLGMVIAPVSLVYSIPYTISGKKALGDIRWELALDVLFWTGIFLFWIFGRKFYRQFSVERMYRSLGKWEKNLLHGTGLFLLTIGTLMAGVDGLGASESTARIFTGFGSLSAVLLEISAIALVQQGNKRGYFQYLNGMNEHYLKAELEHFKAYQESEKKIRRFRHDIRNHLICLRELAKKGKTEELRSYTEELLQGIEAANGMICCGNEIADAIINEKNLLAKQKGIHLTVEGRMPSECPIKATDICTLFSNALDNALEAQAKWEEQNPQEKWIRVQICRQGRMICLCFENPAGPADRILPWGSTSKENAREHGLGNLNMIYAAEKYNGKVTAVIEEKNGKRVYCLEILLFVPKAA